MSFSRRRFLLGSTALLHGCGSALRRFPFDQSDPPSTLPGLEITYYSVGCFLLRWRDTAVLTDPFWSHLSFPRVAFGRTLPDPRQVDSYLPELSTVESILVGHSHYDHVLDLPHIAPHVAPGARVYGSQTLAHTFAPSELPLDFHVVNDQQATPEQSGAWVWAVPGKVRILPIESGHPNNYAFIHLFTDRLDTDRDTTPVHASDYQEGITLAFLVDFLDSTTDTIVHRVYVQTSSRGWPDGFFPPSILEERNVDVALLAMDCANIEARGHQDSIIDFLTPETVIFCHWENFFRRKDQSPREIVKVDLPRLRRHFEADSRSNYRFPDWDTRHHFPDE